MKVTIELTDQTGGVEATVAFSSDFDVNSNAHQVGNLLLKYLDTLLEKKDMQDVTPKEVVGVAV